MSELRTNLKHSFLSLIFVLASWSAPIRAAEIHLRAEATAAGRVVRLGDIAEISAIDRAEQQSLAAIELMPVSANTADQKLALNEIQDLLAARGVAVGNHTFSGASEVRLAGGVSAASKTRNLRPIGSAARGASLAVQTAIARYLAETVDAGRDWHITVELTDDQIRAVSAAYGRILVSGGSEPWHGAQQFTIQAGGKDQAFAIEADVRAPDMVVVAARSLTKGDVVRASDLSLTPAKRGAAQKTAYRSIDDVVGKEAVRSVNAGQVIDANYVQAPVLVRRGEVVTVYAHAAGVRLKTTARARQDGGKGEQIEVEAIGDRRRYFATVTDVQIVEVFAGAVRAELNSRN